ncbi:MAG TPA: family 16 glycoside hydrolase [Methylomirabilota bacterium]|nr:family 16 glycoside hydrolase [Methylomirabilota bacterium]
MPLQELIPGANPARDDVQQTAFVYDVLGRYICNNWPEILAAQGPGGYPFDVVVVGAGMYGAYCAEKLYRSGGASALRILVLDAGAFLLPSHIQNLPQQLGGKVGGPNYLRRRDDATGAQNVIWGMPWISNESFPGLAYCIGGRSLFWGGWSPELTDADLANWPKDVVTYLKSAGGYGSTATEIGTATTTDFISQSALFNALLNGIKMVISLDGITEVGEAPLAVQGAAPRSGLFAFDKFSSAPFLMDAIRSDVAVNTGYGDLSRRIFLVPRTQVHRLNVTGNTVTSIDLSVAGVRQLLSIAPGTTVVIANGTVEASRLVLESLGVGSQQFGSPRVGNLMAHLRSNITVRIKRAALGLATPPTEVETTALIVRGSALGRRFHHQITAAAAAGPNPESNMWSMIPDIDLIDNLLGKQDPNWVVITLRGIGEMEDQRVVNNIDPARSWIDLSQETDQWGMRRAYVQLVATQNDRALWAAMDKSAFDLAKALAKSPANIEYWNSQTNQWQATQPQPDANGQGFWQDFLGTTHHEAGSLFMGTAGASIVDTNGKFHGKANAYAVGPAVFPTLGSANPSLTALSLARRTANAIVSAAGPGPLAGFAPLSLAPGDWQMVKLPNSPAGMIHYGTVMETSGWYGLYWYIKEQFRNFALSLDWRISRREENSGVYIRIPAPSVANALQEADAKGHEVQIDQRGYDSVTNTEGHPLKVTGAIYDLQAPSASTGVQIGAWNNYLIEANGPRIRVTLNGQLVNDYQSSRQQAGYIALQAHDSVSRTQFRNLQVKKLP